MYLKKISVTNYRSCMETQFTPNAHLSALIGPNGTGKTNVLTAICLLRLLIRQNPYHYRRDEHPATSESKIKTWFDVDGKTVIHTAKLHLYTDEHNNSEILASDEHWYMRDLTGSKKRIKLPIEIFVDLFHPKRVKAAIHKRHLYRNYYLYGGKKKGFFLENFSAKDREALGEVAEFIHNIEYYSASQFTDPSRCPIAFEVEKDGIHRRGIAISGHKRLLFDMYQEYRNKTDRYEEYLSLVNRDGVGLVDDIRFEETQVSSSEYSVLTGGKVKKKELIKNLIIPQFIVGKNRLSPSQLSEGTFKTLSLLFYLVTGKSSLLMIEEPEVCVHHGLLDSIIELIKQYSRDRQIIISTHSDSVLDSLNVDNVYTVTKPARSGTKVCGISKALRQKELKALMQYLRTDGSLGEYWKCGDLEDE
jgi:AAA ATPase domain